MTDTASVVGASRESLSRVVWVPPEAPKLKIPNPELFVAPPSIHKGAESIHIIFENFVPNYPAVLLVLFVATALLAALTLLGLMLTPLIQVASVTTALLFGLALGLGGLAFAVGRAERIRERL